MPRRVVVRGGLATFASLVASRFLPGCDGPVAMPDAASPAPDASLSEDAASIADAYVAPDAAVATSFTPNPMPARPSLRSLIADIGPLGAANADGVRVPEGFTAQILARAGEPVAPSDYVWHTYPDGGTCFATMDGGWIYVSNSEMPITGGVGCLRFDATGAVTSAQRLLERTNINCAGGGTPWGSWLSCEESARGFVYEVDPHGMQAPQVRPALGVFKHEAVAVDPMRGHLYLTEDEPEGCFYRFPPAVRTADGPPEHRRRTPGVASGAPCGLGAWPL